MRLGLRADRVRRLLLSGCGCTTHADSRRADQSRLVGCPEINSTTPRRPKSRILFKPRASYPSQESAVLLGVTEARKSRSIQRPRIVPTIRRHSRSAQAASAEGCPSACRVSLAFTENYPRIEIPDQISPRRPSAHARSTENPSTRWRANRYNPACGTTTCRAILPLNPDRQESSATNRTPNFTVAERSVRFFQSATWLRGACPTPAPAATPAPAPTHYPAPRLPHSLDFFFAASAAWGRVGSAAGRVGPHPRGCGPFRHSYARVTDLTFIFRRIVTASRPSSLISSQRNQ